MLNTCLNISEKIIQQSLLSLHSHIMNTCGVSVTCNVTLKCYVTAETSPGNYTRLDCEQSLFFSVSHVREGGSSGEAMRRSRETRETRAQPEKKKKDCPHSQSQWNMHWPHNAKIQLANAWSVDNKLSTIETIDKMMMAVAKQECFVPENWHSIKKQNKVKHWKLLSPVMTLLIYCNFAHWFWKKPDFFNCFVR